MQDWPAGWPAGLPAGFVCLEAQAATRPPAQLATTLLRRSAAAPQARPTRNPPRSRRSERSAARQAPGIAPGRGVGSKCAAVPRSPARARAVPHLYSAANLHGAEGALEERVSGALVVLRRAVGALCQQALRKQGAAPAGNRPVAGAKRAAAGRGGRGCGGVMGGWRRWPAPQGRGALGAPVERICEAVRARREQGRAGAYLAGCAETGGRRKRKSNRTILSYADR